MKRESSSLILTYVHMYISFVIHAIWQSTPVLLPGKSHGQRSLLGYTVHGVTKSRTRMSDFTFTFQFHKKVLANIHTSYQARYNNI